MRTTVTIDDDLLEQARALTGSTESSVLMRLALETLVQVETSKRLAALGGSDEHAEAPTRRRSAAGR